MSDRVRRGIAAAGVALVLVAGVPAIMPGCASKDADVTAMVPENIRGLMNQYLGDMGSVTDMLRGVTTPRQASDALPRLGPALDNLNSTSNSLSRMVPEVRDNVLKAFGPQLEQANSALTAQINRITGDPSLNNVLGPLLKNVKLFG